METTDNWHELAIRQADFLVELSRLLNEYNACGQWIPYHEELSHLDADRCIAATKATVEHAKDLAPPPAAPEAQE